MPTAEFRERLNKLALRIEGMFNELEAISDEASELVAALEEDDEATETTQGQ